MKSKQSSLKSLQSTNQLANKPTMKQSLRTSKPRANQQEEGDILIKACCPNCRYIFKVVNEAKLNAIKKKLQSLQPIQQEQPSKVSSRVFVINSPENNSKYQNNQTPKLMALNNQTPKNSFAESQILSKSIIQQQSFSKSKVSNISENKIAHGTQTAEALKFKSPKYQKSPLLSERSASKSLMVKTPHKQKVHNQSNAKTPIKSGRKTQMQKATESIQKDINEMKKYLRSSEGKRKYTVNQQVYKEGDQNKQSSLSPKYEYKKNVDKSLSLSPAKKPLTLELDKISELSKSKKELNVSRRCKLCSKSQIDIQLLHEAARSILLQQQNLMMAGYIQKYTSTPSYVKCLKQMTSQQY